nr:unnamed protein product [Digitaria exilis]
MPRPSPDHPPAAAMTVAELEAAVAALPGKRDALQEAFDHLAACSPSPLPFTWEDLDAHLSSLQSSISLRFLQLRALEAARPTPAAAAPGETRAGETGVNLEEVEEEVVVVEEEEEEVVEVEEEEVVEEEDVVEVEEEEVVEEEDVVEVEEVVEEEEEVVEEEAEEKADEEMREGGEEEVDDKIGKDGKDEEEARYEVEDTAADKIGVVRDAKEEGQDAAEEMHVANEEEDAEKTSQDREDDANMEDQNIEDAKKSSQDEEKQDANMEDAKNASAVQGKEQEACGGKQVEEEQEAHKEEQDSKHTTKEEEKANVSRDQDSRIRRGPGGFLNDLAAACTSMDAPSLVKFMHTKVGLSTRFRAPMHRAPDAATLSLCVIELFLHEKMFKSNKVWNNCIGMIRTIPAVVTKLSTESIEHAKRLAKGWKEMLDNPGSCAALGSLASWGLLNFLISYNIVFVFDMKENAIIIKELDNLRMARDLAKQQVTDSGLRSGIMAEISALLAEFGKKKKQSLANASIVLTSNPHQKQAESNKKRKKKQGHHKGQECHQHGKKSKLGEKLDNKQNKPQQEQQQK